MDEKYYESQQTPIQKALSALGLTRRPNVFVTLTFADENGVSERVAEGAFGKFIHSLKCHFYGENSKKRLWILPVIEKAPENMALVKRRGERASTHIHCLMELPGDPMEHKEIISSLWKAAKKVCGDPKVYCPDNEKWFVTLLQPRSRRIYTNYIIKDCKTDTAGVLWKYVPKNERFKG